MWRRDERLGRDGSDGDRFVADEAARSGEEVGHVEIGRASCRERV